MEDRLKLIIEKLKDTLSTYSTCDECPIRHSCSSNGNGDGYYICELIDEIKNELGMVK